MGEGARLDHPAINVTMVKILRLTLPQTLLLRADQVIEWPPPHLDGPRLIAQCESETWRIGQR